MLWQNILKKPQLFYKNVSEEYSVYLNLVSDPYPIKQLVGWTDGCYDTTSNTETIELKFRSSIKDTVERSNSTHTYLSPLSRTFSQEVY